MGPLIGAAVGAGVAGLGWLASPLAGFKATPQFLDQMEGGGEAALAVIRDRFRNQVNGVDPFDPLPWNRFQANPQIARHAQLATAEREGVASRATKLGIGPRSGRVQKALMNANLRQAGADQGAYTGAANQWRQMLEQAKLGGQGKLIDMAMRENEGKVGANVSAYMGQAPSSSPLVGMAGGLLSGALSANWGRANNISGGQYYKSGPAGPGSSDFDAERGVAGY